MLHDTAGLRADTTRGDVDKSKTGASQRLYLIDGLRTICALIVVVYHYDHFFVNPAAQAAGLGQYAYTDMAFFKYIPWILWQGNWAVMVFWTISGFIFAHIYGQSRAISGWKFFVFRFSRLYPLHFVTLIYVALLQFAALQSFGTQLMDSKNSVLNFVLNLFFASAWGGGDNIYSFNLPIWSVSVEIAVYILFFVVLRFVGISLLTTLVVAVLCVPLFVFKTTQIPVCAAYFFIGAAALVALRRIEALAPRVRAAAVPALCLAVACPALIATQTTLHVPLTLIVAPPMAMGLFLLAFFERRLPRAPAFLEPVGDITYSVYLLHVPLQMAFIWAMLAGWVSPLVLLNPVAPWVYIVVVVVAGHYCFRHFERPVQNYLRKVL